MKVKIININDKNYFGISVLEDNKVYLKYYQFSPDTGIQEMNYTRSVEDRQAVDEIYKHCQAYYLDKDKNIQMWSY